MVTDSQVRILMKLVNKEELLKTAAAKAGMSEKTSRKYRKSGKYPIIVFTPLSSMKAALQIFLHV
jgi:hypothetical protein